MCFVMMFTMATAPRPLSIASNTLPPPSIDWIQVIELGYSDADLKPPPNNESICFNCGATYAKLLKCSQCLVGSYCQKDCQTNDWKKGGHKRACESYQRVGPHMEFNSDHVKQQARDDIMKRIQYYSNPYAIHKTYKLGKGFLFIQSNHTLVTMSLLLPKDCYGRVITERFLLLHFLTVGEFDLDVCRDDFEMAMVRTKLHEAVNQYDEEHQLVLLVRFRCGHVALGIITALCPDYGVCRAIGEQYYGNVTAGAVQLNLDDL